MPGSVKITLYCSFCGKGEHEVRKLISAANAAICDSCVVNCFDILQEEGALLIQTKGGARIKVKVFSPDSEILEPPG